MFSVCLQVELNHCLVDSACVLSIFLACLLFLIIQIRCTFPKTVKYGYHFGR